MVSIIVPIHNSAAWLDRCIGSLTRQTYSDLEIILIDDGSEDGSLQIGRKWEMRDRRICVIAQPNRGVSAARNAGIKRATGSHVMLVDSDDWLAADACEVLLSHMRRQDADCVVCGLKQTNGKIWAPAFDRTYEDLTTFKRDFAYWLNTELLSSSVNKIYKRDRIKEPYPEEMAYGEDLVFVLNYLKHCRRISFIRTPLYRHEVYNPVSLTHLFDPARFLDLEHIRQSVWDFADDRGKKEARIHDKYVRDSIWAIRRWYRTEGVSRRRKESVIRQWRENSGLKTLKSSRYPLCWRDRLIWYCLRAGWLAGINWMVNGKELVKHFFKKKRTCNTRPSYER